MNKNILVVAAHPDDEVLGCGGTIAAHHDCGDTVSILIIAEGLTSRQMVRHRDSVKEELESLRDAAQKSAAILGASSIELLSYADNRLDSVDRLDLVKDVESAISRYEPHRIYVHHSGDLNIDHRRINEAVITAARPIPNQGVMEIVSFEVASSTEWAASSSLNQFSPNLFVDISHTLERKMAALRAYECEMRPWPHARSIEGLLHLARLRGSQIGVDAAEAFNIIRRIERPDN